jgi:hypothetical protein
MLRCFRMTGAGWSPGSTTMYQHQRDDDLLGGAPLGDELCEPLSDLIGRHGRYARLIGRMIGLTDS